MDDDSSDSESWEAPPNLPPNFPHYRLLLAIHNLVRQVRDDDVGDSSSDTASLDGFESSQTSIGVSLPDDFTGVTMSDDSDATLVGSQTQSESSTTTTQYQQSNASNASNDSVVSIHSNGEPSTLEIDQQRESLSPALFPNEEVEEIQQVQQVQQVQQAIPHSTTPVKISPKRKRENSISPATKRKKTDEEEDEGSTCPICFDNWTTDGEHRLCSLKCGHLFGHKCVKRWLNSEIKKSCPTCKTKTNVKDIRFLYAKQLTMIDNREVVSLKTELAKSQAHSVQLQLRYDRLYDENERLEKLLADKDRQLESFMNQQRCFRPPAPLMLRETKHYHFALEKTIVMSKEKSCHVMAYHSSGLLVVTLGNPHPVFPPYGIVICKFTDNQQYICEAYNPLHKKTIRDLAFHPQTGELLLSASIDKTAKITNVSTNAVLHTVRTDTPLWSCCWDENQPNIFYVGTQRGVVIQFNQVSTDPLKTFSILGTSSPVHSLISTAPYPNATSGSLVCGTIQVCCVFEFNDDEVNTKRIRMEGPFATITYNKLKKQFLITARANAEHVLSRNILCEFEQCVDAENELKVKQIYCFQGSVTQSLGRNCQLPIYDSRENDVSDVLVAFYQDSKKQVQIWSASSGLLVHTIDAKEIIRDMCFVNRKNLFVTLSDSRLRIYRIRSFI